MSHPVIFNGRQVGSAECELRGGFVVITNIVLTEIPQEAETDYFHDRAWAHFDEVENLIDCE